MRRSLAILCLLAGLAAAPLATHAQQSVSPSQELFVQAFLNGRKGEELATAGNVKGALEAYRDAAKGLSQIKQQFPAWQKELVDFRLGRVNQAITELQAKPQGRPSPVQPDDTSEPSANPKDPIDPSDAAGIVPAIGELGNGPKRNPGAIPPLPEPTLIPDEPPRPTTIKNGGPRNPKTPKAVESSSKDPLSAITEKIQHLETSNAEKDATLEELQLQVKRLQAETLVAQKEQAKAEAARKNSDDLMDVVKREFQALKDKGDTEGARAKELEAKLAELKGRMETEAAERRAAEERAKQLASRTSALAERVRGAGTMPAQIKKLEAELAEARTAQASLTEKLNGVIKERDEARQEYARLKEANKDSDKLIAENASLVKKLAESEKLVQQFQGDIPKKDAEIAMLKKQMAETQKALAASQEKNATLQTEVGDLRKKMDEYAKQLAQYKADKAVGIEERRKLDEENKLLQGIVYRVLQEDANRSQRKKMIVKEMERLHIQSDILLKQLSFMTEPVVKLSTAERRLFKKPIMDIQGSNYIGAVLPSKPDGDAAPTPAPGGTPPADPAEPKSAEPKPADSAEATPPLPTPDPEKPAAKPDSAKPEKAPATSKAPELPVPDPGSPEASPGGGPTAGFQGLPAEAKPIAEQAKKAFEKENYAEAEKLYTRALMFAPKNLYVVSNLGVAQFRSAKYKNAEESFRKAITLAPEDAFSWCTLGIVQYSQNKFDEAVTSLTKSIAINAQNPTAHNYLGITAAQKGWLEHGQKELETAIQLDPKYADAYFNLAVVFTLHKPVKLEDARKAYKKALELGAEPDTAMEGSLNGDATPADNEPKGAGAEINR